VFYADLFGSQWCVGEFQQNSNGVHAGTPNGWKLGILTKELAKELPCEVKARHPCLLHAVVFAEHVILSSTQQPSCRHECSQTLKHVICCWKLPGVVIACPAAIATLSRPALTCLLHAVVFSLLCWILRSTEQRARPHKCSQTLNHYLNFC
jgi:hypothetical protein